MPQLRFLSSLILDNDRGEVVWRRSIQDKRLVGASGVVASRSPPTRRCDMRVGQGQRATLAGAVGSVQKPERGTRRSSHIESVADNEESTAKSSIARAEVC